MSILLLQEEILVIHMTTHSCCQRSSKGCLLFAVQGQGQGKAKLVIVATGRWREYLL